jgi:hypothetical protein
LDVNEVKQLLANMAETDSFTGAVPNNTWGWGKLYLDTNLIGNEKRASSKPGAQLLTVFPNPFCSVAGINYVLDRQTRVGVEVFDSRGRLLERLADGIEGPGAHHVLWNTHDRASGIYLIRLKKANTVRTTLGLLIR